MYNSNFYYLTKMMSIISNKNISNLFANDSLSPILDYDDESHDNYDSDDDDDDDDDDDYDAKNCYNNAKVFIYIIKLMLFYNHILCM